MAKENPKTGRPLKVTAKERGGKITTAGRLGLTAGQFALPPSAEEKARGLRGRYPIDTEERARNALARVSAYGTPAEKRAVRNAVHRKYPNIEIGEMKGVRVVSKGRRVK